MDQSLRIELLRNIDFGEIDGYADPNLHKYFLDNNYWDKIIDEKNFYVIGKKGTGKSSIYRMIKDQATSKNVHVENKDFGEFPFEKLLNLADDDFAIPNQYQSIWKQVIFNIFSRMIVQNGKKNSKSYSEISQYVEVCLGKNIVDLHKTTVTNTFKTNTGLKMKSFSASAGLEQNHTFDMENMNITQTNERLHALILDYLSDSSEEKYIIQFDRLDDNYNTYQDLKKYFQSIISLFKVTYKLNQELRNRHSGSKIVLYLRNDIYRELSSIDSESARWEDYILKIDWAIINKSDWNNPPLLQMINMRIRASDVPISTPIEFNTIFDSTSINLRHPLPNGDYGDVIDVFYYITNKTLHRPRDLIMFSKKIQNEVNSSGSLNYRTIKNAEKEFSSWLVNSELKNEINPILKNVEPVYEMLKQLGRQCFSLSDFTEKYKSARNINMDKEELVNYLYDIGILYNVDVAKNYTIIRSTTRNPGKLDRNMKIQIHPGVWKGLTV